MDLAVLRTAAELRAAAADWDGLWARSDLGSHLWRAECVADWIDHFAPRASLAIALVRSGGQLIAALPLVGRRWRGVVPVADTTTNDWSPCGELLVDPTTDVAAAMRCLLGGVRRLRWPLVRLAMIPLEEPRWQAFCRAADALRLPTRATRRYEIGTVELDAGFDRLTAGWSKNHRKNLRKDERRLAAAGPIEFHYHAPTAADVDARLDEALALEERSWKGASGTSIRSSAGVEAYYRGQARRLAAWGALRIALLRHGGRPIAFEYGWIGKRTYYSFKVGYDPDFAGYAPGHLLRLRIVDHLCQSGEARRIDFHGPMTEALAQWTTGRYTIGRLLVGLRFSGRLMLRAAGV